MFAQMLGGDRVLVLTSPVFDFTSPHLPKHVRYVGAQLDDPTWSQPWQSPWPASDTRPLVLVGLSSTFQNQTATLRRIVQALSGLPVRALLTLGGTIRPDEVTGSDNVVVVPSAPHGQVLPHVSVLITHCGHGTTLKGLAAGVPLVCLPMGRDQDDTAARVVYRGAGVRLKPSAPAAKIRAAVQHVLETPSYRENAGRLAAALRAGEGCVAAVAELEELASRGGEASPLTRSHLRPPDSALP
jgi:MGT family glycosyltransferase